MTTKKTSNKYLPLVLLGFLLIAVLLVKQCNRPSEPIEPVEPVKPVKTVRAVTEKTTTAKGFNRRPSVVNYSRHARCRMACRHISEAEVVDILRNGEINYRKSDIGNKADCKRKYALEGNTADGQRVRIIFAPCQTEVTVVTVIDIGREWQCDCN